MPLQTVLRFFQRKGQDDATISLDKIPIWKLTAIGNYPVLPIVITILFFFGLSVQYSAGGLSACLSHSIKWAIAGSVAVIFARIPIRTLLRLSPWAYALGLCLLLYVALLGWATKGAQRWIHLGLIRIEPSEFFKIIMPLYLTQTLSLSPKNQWSFLTLLRASLFIAPVILLILKQPDLGTALVVLFLSITTLLLADMPLRWVLIPACILCCCSPILWTQLHSYQQQRILNLLNPDADPLGTGYHILQSIIAIGSGGYVGKGFLRNTQSQLDYLPEHNTDFVFALWAEEQGFLGCFLLIALFFILSLELLKASVDVKNRSAALLLQIVAIQFALSSCINMGMVLGLLPVVGVPLPFLSFGGCNALMNGISLGIAYSCMRHARIERSFL